MQLKTLEKVANVLKIPTPFNIEALDISNIFLDDAVASFSVFINGEYRDSKLYKLAPERSDPDYMRSACRRHYGKAEQSRIPDLVVVDGAREQIRATLGVLEELRVNSRVIGLVKNPRHQTEKMMNDNFEEVGFTSREVKNFFIQMQEIVHNKAIASHRKLHGKNTLKVSEVLAEESTGD